LPAFAAYTFAARESKSVSGMFLLQFWSKASYTRKWLDATTNKLNNLQQSLQTLDVRAAEQTTFNSNLISSITDLQHAVGRNDMGSTSYLT
jgi:hypothetical protein